MTMFYQLFRPLAYLLIKHPEKWKFDWLTPLILSFLTAALFFVAHGKVNLYGGGGVLSSLIGLVQGLPGFFIAALAAVATFNRNDLDNLIADPTPEIEIHIRNQATKIKLTRRRFLCLLFAFLTTESLVFVVLSILAINFAPTLSQLLLVLWGPQALNAAFAVATMLLALVFWQMAIATLLGLYYLGDRLHQPDGNGHSE